MNEDHGQWALGSYGNREINTPTLDYLAKTGVQMDNAFTPTPVCSPSRACLLTGRLASQHGVHDYLATIPENEDYDWLGNEITLSELLTGAGYQTALCGKWHLGRDNEPQAGFEVWFTHSADYPIEHGGRHRFSDQGRVITLTGYKTQILTDRAISFLRQRDVNRPFFLMVSYTASHSPWNNHPERLVEQYRQSSFGDIPADVAYPFGRQNLESTFDFRLQPREGQAQYYASVSQVDEAVGRIVDELEALGLRESTLLVFLSDHGLSCGQHGIWGKGNGTLPLNMVEESIRIPLIFNQPGFLYNRQHRREFVDHCDTFQTLVEYAGLELPVRAENYYPGRSFLPLLDNSAPVMDWRGVQFGEYGDLRMVRTETHKLIRRYLDGSGELFDLQQDPRETVNLLQDPALQPLVERLTFLMEDYFTRYQDAIKSGLRVRELPQHNLTEAWRTNTESAEKSHSAN
jgi:arylsulfatase A-like enzyme